MRSYRPRNIFKVLFLTSQKSLNKSNRKKKLNKKFLTKISLDLNLNRVKSASVQGQNKALQKLKHLIPMIDKKEATYPKTPFWWYLMKLTNHHPSKANLKCQDTFQYKWLLSQTEGDSKNNTKSIKSHRMKSQKKQRRSFKMR